MPTNFRFVFSCLFATTWLACTVNVDATTPPAPTGSQSGAELDRLVADVCHKRVVLLGEDASHGSGKTLEIKTALVERLIDRCGFSAVIFESQIYDFLDLEQAFASKTATPEKLADAIGGLWSTTRESEPLVAYLYRAAAAGRVRLAGMDPQLGGATQLFSQRDLPRQLAAYLHGERKAQCTALLERHTHWSYDDSTPYDDAEQQRLLACASDIEATITAQPESAAIATASIMASNLRRYVAMSKLESTNPRDRAMYDNLVWHRKRLPPDAKVIVWCATVHAAKKAPPGSADLLPLGSFVDQSLGHDAAAIGFSALAGSYGRKATVLGTAAAGSLEQRALGDSADELHYLDRSVLAALGSVSARALNYGKPETAHWDTLLDGLVVLRQEQPPHYVRKAVPQQADSTSQGK